MKLLWILSGLSFIVSLRWVVSFHSYSGEGKPPMYGDFEAQRHWMEITYNLPIHQWYVNSSNNDLQYWGLDYPPLTAYHSWLCAFVQSKINVSWVELETSRGLEDPSHKLFMRYSVLVVDLLIFIPALFLYFLCFQASRHSFKNSLFSAVVMLSYPGLILIDHAHFQYNCMSLGLLLWAVLVVRVGCGADNDADNEHEDSSSENTDSAKEHSNHITSISTPSLVISSIFFSLSLNYKQMQLYHSLAFFFFFLGNILFSKSYFYDKMKSLLMVASSVLLTFTLCWLPFLSSMQSCLQVLHRLFPFSRGLFEDKVSNFWCSLSVVLKLKNILSTQALIRLCSVTTLISVTPSCVSVFLRPTFKQFTLSLFNVSLSFFLFSYQVHEKSILLAAVPMMLLYKDHPVVAVWFLITSTYSMLPLLIKDGLVSASVSCTIIFFILSSFRHHWDSPQTSIKSPHHTIIDYLFNTSLVAMAFFSLVLLCLPPLAHLPDLHTLIVSTSSCAQFMVFLVYFNAIQIYNFPSHKSLKRDHLKTN